MKHLLRNKATHLFLSPEGLWLGDAERAKNFRSTLEALDECHKQHLKDMEVVLHFDPTGTLDMKIDLPA